MWTSRMYGQWCWRRCCRELSDAGCEEVAAETKAIGERKQCSHTFWRLKRVVLLVDDEISTGSNSKTMGGWRLAPASAECGF